MNSNDLFSFLEDVPPDDGAMDTDAAGSLEELPKKRKATFEGVTLPRSPNEDLNRQEISDEPGPSVPKKPRFASPKPVVVDEFETEAKREVAASAGLTGGIEPGSRLELRYQVHKFTDCHHSCY